MRARFVRMMSEWLGLWLTITGPVGAQQTCADRLTFTPVSRPNLIEWSKFPDFTLPFTVIFGGPRLGDTQGSPLLHGFSHIVNVQDAEFGTTVPLRQWAVEYSGFATGLNQPWETIESPWANDMNAYRAKWDRYLSELSGGQKNAAGQYVVRASRLVIDVERIAETEARMLRLKLDSRVPETYRRLPDAEFVATYKRDMRNLYAEGLRYVRQNADLTGVSVSSYADTPVLNTYLNVPGNAWSDWTTNLSRVNYLVKDEAETRVGGPFYDQLDALSPSAYYYYDYPNPLATDYLAYLLFQVEVNRAWSNKPVVPWVWMRYHDSSSSYPNFIQPFMAEATAIFPFFSGAAGLWLWDDQNLSRTRTDVHAAYEHFIHGLYRLSRFADQFQGTYELVIETPARDLMDKQLPVWRGVVKNNTILVAAQNPYAAEGAKTSLTVRYKNWGRTIELTGREVFLCRFDMSAVTATEPVLANVAIFPNPASTSVTVRFGQTPATSTELMLQTTTGQVLRRQPAKAAEEVLNVAELPAGLYLLRIETEAGSRTEKIIIGR